jgi:hypothetical protein
VRQVRGCLPARALTIAYYDEHEDAQETVRWIEDAGRRALVSATAGPDRAADSVGVP